MPRTRPRKCLLNAVVLITITVIAGVILTTFTTDDDNSKQLNPQVHTKYVHVPDHSMLMANAKPLLPGVPQNTLKSSYSATPQHDSKLSEWLHRFPHFMIIGFGKTGTKALYEALKLHPKLSGPYKEQRFFSRHYSKGVKSYLSAFPPAPEGGYTIEKSPDYIISEEVPERILSTVNGLGIDASSLKFIVVLRDPVDRAVSEYLEWNIQRLDRHNPRLPPFERMIFDENSEINSSLPFINASCYVQHISNWLRYFPKEQMCVVDGDRFVSNPYAELHQLEECMGLGDYFSEQNFVYDKQKGFYCFRDNQKNSEAICMGSNKGRKHPKLSKNALDKLYNFFRPCNAKMLDVAGRKFHVQHN